MSANDKLHKLMMYKANCVSRELGIDAKVYYDEPDKKAIYDLLPGKAKEIVKQLIKRLEAWQKSNPVQISDIASMPFCWVYPCVSCPYAKTHGVCNQKTSPDKKTNQLDDYSIICKALSEKYGKEVVLINSICKTRHMINILKFGTTA